MGRFDRGYVKVWRSIYSDNKQKNIFYGKGHAILVFQTLISWANYEDGKTALGRQKVFLKRGQLSLSHKELQNALGLTRQNIRSALNWLKSTNQVTIESTNAGTIVTIPDYDKFQDKNLEGNQPGNQPGNQRVTNGQPTGNQRVTNGSPHIEEVKKERKKESKKERKKEYSPDVLSVAKEWATYTSEVTGNKSEAEAIDRYADGVQKIINLMEWDAAKVRWLLGWIKQNDFWRDKCQSPANLVKIRDGQRKINTILGQIKKPHDDLQGLRDFAYGEPEEYNHPLLGRIL